MKFLIKKSGTSKIPSQTFLQAEELKAEELEQVSGGVSLTSMYNLENGSKEGSFYYSAGDTKDQVMGKIIYEFSARGITFSAARQSEIRSYIREGYGGTLKITIDPDGSLSVISY
ncbi:MAG: hypothetical protein LUD16_04825 [Lachnospiraceae bacterium]|nr:hypothetical protein [Lachnospiraceae bacterium]